MEKEFVTYEQALALKELGFDEPCFGWYQSIRLKKEYHPQKEHSGNQSYMRKEDCTAPTFSQVFRWFREKYNLRGFIGFRPNVKKFDYHIYDMSLSGMEYVKQRTMEAYNNDPTVGTYDEAENACIDKLIEIAKQQ